MASSVAFLFRWTGNPIEPVFNALHARIIEFQPLIRPLPSHGFLATRGFFGGNQVSFGYYLRRPFLLEPTQLISPPLSRPTHISRGHAENEGTLLVGR